MLPCVHSCLRASVPFKRGFTLAESLVASVVLAVAVVAVSGAIVAAQKQTVVQEEDSVAVSLGKELMEEIASRRLSLPDNTAGWPTVTDRSTYDTISDFSGYSDELTVPVYHGGVTTAMTSFSSARPTVTILTSGVSSVQPGPQQYTRTVSVTYPTSIFGTSVSSGEFAKVVVTVQGAGGISVQLTRLFSKITVSR